MANAWVYDLETYPNCFTAAFEHAEAPFRMSFEISNYRNDTPHLMAFLSSLKARGCRLVGYNNLGFDYPILHTLIRMGMGDAGALYDKAMAIIGSQDREDRFVHSVKPSDCYIPQVDLMKIHHFDNAAKMTSLKMLEFNMRSENIVDLPFPVGTVLTQDQIKVLREYNAHDVAQTKKFYHESKGMIAFRDELSRKYNRDFTNHNDTKIGKDYFVMELEKAGIQIYNYGKDGRKPRQTPRSIIHLRDAILPHIQFQHPEFTRVLTWLKQQSITETKGALKEPYTKVVKGVEKIHYRDVVAEVNGFKFVFGTGGIHGSISNEIVRSDDEYTIIDLDVASYYPNLAITNGFYPEHLGQPFVYIYKNLFEQRKKYPKKSAESQMLKLALNGVYGDSNNVHSVFYDPLFTMRITMNGQLLLCMLAEQLMNIPTLRMLQINTDGVTVRVGREYTGYLEQVCEWWMKGTGLVLENAQYKMMAIRDCNNYIAVREDGSTKRKGAYEWQAGGWYADGYNGWHQNASCPIVARVAEMVLTKGVNIRETIEGWTDLHDFMLRTKVQRTHHLKWGDEVVQRISRYIVTKTGRSLIKWMPPLGPDKNGNPRDNWRPTEVEAGWLVTVCNNIEDARGVPINHDYYVAKVEKLVMVLR